VPLRNWGSIRPGENHPVAELLQRNLVSWECENLQTIGHLIAERRRAKGLTLTQLASQAAVGRSTLAALEAGKLPELGLERVARLCAAVDLVLEARPLALNQPLMAHRHLSEAAGRELTKAAIGCTFPPYRSDKKRGSARAHERTLCRV
jgi:transcriptional regulator with XRE-family HTH domain